MTREDRGRLVRATWVAWAQTQPDIDDHPSWLLPWEQLTDRDREVDCLIGDAVANQTSHDLSSIKVIVCPECKGIRRTWVSYLHTHIQDVPHWESCLTCNGSGFVIQGSSGS